MHQAAQHDQQAEAAMPANPQLDCSGGLMTSHLSNHTSSAGLRCRCLPPLST